MIGDSLFWNIFELSICLLENYLLLDFVTRLLGFRIARRRRVPAFIGSLGVCFAFSLIENHPSIQPVEFFITILLLFSYAMLFLKGHIWQKVGTAAIARGLLLLANSFVMFICSDIFGVTIGDIITKQDLFRIVIVVLTKISFYFVCKIFLGFTKKERGLNSWQWMVAAASLLFSTLAGTLSISLATHLEDTGYDKVRLFVIVISIWAVCIITYYLIARMAKDNSLRMELALLKQSQAFQAQALEAAKNSSLEMRQIKHDMKNYMLSLGIMINSKQYEEAEAYCEQLTGKIQRIHATIHTDSPVIDGFINAKLYDSRRNDIDTRLAVTANLKNLDQFYFSTVFSNLMDNAIEAEMALPVKDRFISITIAPITHMVCVCIENRITCPVLKTNPDLATTKKDNKNHGLGHKSVKSALEECGGYIHYEEKDGMFVAKAMFPAPNPPQKPCP